MDDSMRISDADREAAVRLLGEQFAEGRLDKDEFDERSDAAWSARTWGDLDPLFLDLPVRSPRTPAPVPTGGPHAPAPRSGRGFPVVPVLVLLVALMVLTRMPMLMMVILVWLGVSLFLKTTGRGGRGCGR